MGSSADPKRERPLEFPINCGTQKSDEINFQKCVERKQRKWGHTLKWELAFTSANVFGLLSMSSVGYFGAAGDSTIRNCGPDQTSNSRLDLRKIRAQNITENSQISKKAREKC